MVCLWSQGAVYANLTFFFNLRKGHFLLICMKLSYGQPGPASTLEVQPGEWQMGGEALPSVSLAEVSILQ
jgi:hypothetical protein